jgi:hypothetical protein
VDCDNGIAATAVRSVQDLDFTSRADGIEHAPPPEHRFSRGVAHTFS